MVGDEADGADEEVFDALVVEAVGVVDDVGFEPGDFAIAGGGLPDDVIVGDAELVCDESGGFVDLAGIEGAVSIGAGVFVGDDGDGVSGEDEADVFG